MSVPEIRKVKIKCLPIPGRVETHSLSKGRPYKIQLIFAASEDMHFISTLIATHKSYQAEKNRAAYPDHPPLPRPFHLSRPALPSPAPSPPALPSRPITSRDPGNT
ncbi:hypothetical protein METBIDRAFT_188857 [Metschnikowia bicuspidata var. bicuspidata NRRL YB-4993]|uniref:Uncharacterized protein n=1 Tax=Metschnikowia bicuspidata var. bicuspidata NRRL YB-4993 TaxID=869754 RepID=A0A1A0HCH7_9ASCO|nr:hypothetical protein METBIDRAFT_188857 [Metschnikowia bicuspidata var. bicuspidata NRRL YB-4993]OBA21618.1 hypothetical protein METBIDRAFT_188857 [Metschnikowia bicuspidata var. bicuspidata NRRL YB-4993]